jgi:hypothetical protein
MAIIQPLTEKDLAERFFLLPQSLQDALEDEFNAGAIREICAQYGITDEDIIGGVADVVAKILLGFAQPEDLAQGLKEEIGFPEEVAQDVSLKIRSGIFAPLMGDIQKIYSPTIARDIGLKPGIMPAASMMDISTSAAPIKFPTVPATAPINPMSVPPIRMAPRMPMPNPAAMAIPKAPAPTAPAKEEPKGWQPTKLPVSGPTPIVGATPISTATPAPFMMHQESSASQLVTSSDFKLNISKDMFKSGPTKQIDVPRPPKAAELEIGKAPLPPKPAGNVSFRTSPLSQSRVVHYTDLRTGMAPGFPAAQPMPKTAPAAPTMTMPKITTATPAAMTSAPIMPAAKPAMAPVLKTMSAPIPPAPTMPSMPKPPEPIKMAIPPSAPMPIAPAPMRPPKVVNFGPEEVK